MTEQEWLECIDPTPMLEFLRGKASARKLRLFAVACCRGIWVRLTDARLKTVVETTELFADGLASVEALEAAQTVASDALQEIYSDANEQRWYYVEKRAAEAVSQACRSELSEGTLLDVVTYCTESIVIAADFRDEVTTWQQEHNIKAHWLRDIFGNPFRPVPVNPAWLTWNDGTVRRTAQSIYDTRACDRLPILADALEEAGCDNQRILDHCRQPGEHVRGCYVVDAVLNKE